MLSLDHSHEMHNEISCRFLSLMSIFFFVPVNIHSFHLSLFTLVAQIDALFLERKFVNQQIRFGWPDVQVFEFGMGHLETCFICRFHMYGLSCCI